jgi:hypothetical protein
MSASARSMSWEFSDALLSPAGRATRCHRWRSSRSVRNCSSANCAGTKSPLALGLSFKLLLAPLLLAGLYIGVLRATGEVIRITLFEAAMGPQIGGAVVAIQHGLNPPLITLMVGIGITLSFLTLPVWWYALQML